MAKQKKKKAKKKPVKIAKEKGRSFIKKRMEDFKEGEMHSTTKHGPVVTNPKQAIAIALSEARKKHMPVSKKKRK